MRAPSAAEKNEKCVDPLHDDGKEYADDLSKAGVQVHHRNFDGVSHEFFGTGTVADKVNVVFNYAAEGLATVFTKHSANVG